MRVQSMTCLSAALLLVSSVALATEPIFDPAKSPLSWSSVKGNQSKVSESSMSRHVFGDVSTTNTDDAAPVVRVAPEASQTQGGEAPVSLGAIRVGK